MHLRSLKKTRKGVSLHDPIGTDKEGNEITLIDIFGTYNLSTLRSQVTGYSQEKEGTSFINL